MGFLVVATIHGETIRNDVAETLTKIANQLKNDPLLDSEFPIPEINGLLIDSTGKSICKYTVKRTRQYIHDLSNFSNYELMTVDKYKQHQNYECFYQELMDIFWVKDSKVSADSVFSSSQEDATHVLILVKS